MRTGISWLDVKLGARMIAKHPGLTVVGGLGLAVVIALGAISFDVTAALLSRLPLDEGDRVVAIETVDARWNDQERQILHDFVEWRAQLGMVRELGAFRTTQRNLIAPGGVAKPVGVAEITASGFTVARVRPLLGRHLLPEDELASAPHVVVIGYDVWRSRFDADPEVVGRELRLGGTVHAIVGVMPDGFGFPVNHELWVPLRANPSDFARREGPALFVFGRLAPNATLERAQAELSTIGARAAAEHPATHASLRPRVVPYRLQFYDGAGPWTLRSLQIVILLLLVVVSTNVAVLVYARTATRHGEIVVRTALGASRRRIVAQLFAEALVLSLIAAAVGLGATALVYRKADEILSLLRGVPFWIDFGLSSGTIIYATVLAILGAVVVGVIPALQATGRRVREGLARLGAGSGMRFGRTWTVLVVAQVAFAVAALPAAISSGSTMIEYGLRTPGFAADEFLTARLRLDRDVPPTSQEDAYDREYLSRFLTARAELLRRLEAEPEIAGALIMEGVPGLEPQARIEREDTLGGSARTYTVGTRRVDPAFFDAFDVAVLAGRTFRPGDARDEAILRLRDGDGDGFPEFAVDAAAASASPIVVSRSLVDVVFGGTNAVGRRIRFIDERSTEPGPWLEIVGVVSDFPARAMESDQVQARVYHPSAAAQMPGELIAMHVTGADAERFTGRLREIAAEVDPSMRIVAVLTLDALLREEQLALRLGALAIGLVAVSVLLLSAAGIHALMSFTVAQRRREIGVRAALGGEPRRILAAIFSRAFRQLAIGAAVGIVAAFVLDRAAGGGLLSGNAPLLLVGVAGLMMAVGLLAAAGPARRGLSVQPTEALKAEG